MARHNILLALTLLAVMSIAACTSGATTPAASTVVPVPSATTAAATASPQPSVSQPSVAPSTPVAETPPPAAPAEGLADFTPGERYLLDGVLRGATDCQPAAGSDEMPRDAIAGIECSSPDPAVARIAFYLFNGDQPMLKAYVAEMKALKIELETGSCDDRGGEHSYAPGVDVIIERVACFLDDEGTANYRALLPVAHVSIGIRGRSSDMQSLEDFAWLGKQGEFGSPTLWAEPR
jgi:hypothetical protein